MFNKFTTTCITPADFYDEWDKTIKAWLDCTKPFDNINPLNGLNDAKKSLSLQYLPEPYYGDMEQCSIVIINLNPGTGLCEQCHLRQGVKDLLVNDVKKNGYSKIAKAFPLDGKQSSVHLPKESLDWWKSRLEWIDRILECKLGADYIKSKEDKSKEDKKKPFAVELVPLHSKSFKVDATNYINAKYASIIGVIDYAISKSDAKMGLAVGKPICNVLLQNGYQIVYPANGTIDTPYKPKSKERYYCVIANSKGTRILCTWSSGSNKAPSDDFQPDEHIIIKKVFKP